MQQTSIETTNMPTSAQDKTHNEKVYQNWKNLLDRHFYIFIILGFIIILSKADSTLIISSILSYMIGVRVKNKK